jgi:uncharacterized protein (DUF983 family)
MRRVTGEFGKRISSLSNPTQKQTPEELPPSTTTRLSRALRLRCPRCGEGYLFQSWFRMRKQCDWCGLVYEREPGFFLGSAYVNYTVTGGTVVLVSVMYFAFLMDKVPKWVVFGPLGVFCLLLPMWFFRYARSLWLAIDQYWDPQPPE